MNQVTGVALLGQALHQTVLAVSRVHPEDQPGQQETGAQAQGNAHPLADTGKVKHDDCQQDGGQAARKDIG